MCDEPFRVSYTKWGGRAHWSLTMRRIGVDERGTWLAHDAGTIMSRPGHSVELEHAAVLVVPHVGDYTAMFNDGSNAARPPGCAVYVDITTTPVWGDGVVSMVDLDLDVIRYWDGTVVVVDEDELALHQVLFGYPAELIEQAERSCASVQEAVRQGAEPFATVGQAWLDRWLSVPGRPFGHFGLDKSDTEQPELTKRRVPREASP